MIDLTLMSNNKVMPIFRRNVNFAFNFHNGIYMYDSVMEFPFRPLLHLVSYINCTKKAFKLPFKHEVYV